jgi:hypothetical protein
MKHPSDRLFSKLLAFLLAAMVPGPAHAQASLLFSSGFESATALLPPSQNDCYATGCWQRITGTDSATGFAWPPDVWGSGATNSLFHLLADAPVQAATIREFTFNQIVVLPGHAGAPTSALYRQLTQSGCCGQNPQSGATQNIVQLSPAISAPGEETDLYISYWLKLQPDLDRLMQVGQAGAGWHWRALFEWKTSGDYRVIVFVRRDPYLNDGNPFWVVMGDNEANGGLPYARFWEVTNSSVPVPVGQWFKFELFWHRSSGSDGRVWAAVNGQVICDRFGRNMASSDPADPEYGFPDSPRPIDRIFVNNVYGSTAYPMYQWMDDLQIWNGFPATCTDPPCAPH